MVLPKALETRVLVSALREITQEYETNRNSITKRLRKLGMDDEQITAELGAWVKVSGNRKYTAEGLANIKAAQAKRWAAYQKQGGGGYKCRYKGCREGPFETSQGRTMHERRAHGDLQGDPNVKRKAAPAAQKKAKAAPKKSHGEGKTETQEGAATAG